MRNTPFGYDDGGNYQRNRITLSRCQHAYDNQLPEWIEERNGPEEEYDCEEDD